MDIVGWDTETISALTSIVMAAIWLVYLQLFYMQYKRNNRPVLIIHHAQGNDPGASCLFVNMSKEPVHVQCVIAVVRSGKGYIKRYITDYTRITPQDQNVQKILRQGPIQPGGYLVLGSFEDIILGRQSVLNRGQRSPDLLSRLQGIQSLELRIAVVHGPSKYHIGARRRFKVEHHEEEKIIIRALNIYTEQLVSRKKRKIVRKWIESDIEPSYQGEFQSPDTAQNKNVRSNQ